MTKIWVRDSTLCYNVTLMFYPVWNSVTKGRLQKYFHSFHIDYHMFVLSIVIKYLNNLLCTKRIITRGI